MDWTARQQQLLEIIKEKQYAGVEELAQLTYTSPSSIRRDLTRLQNAGLVRRMHGGVTLPEPMAGVAGFYSRCNANSREKRAVARRAAALLQDGMTVFLDSSSTSTYMLPFIAAFSDITVYTCNLQMALDGLQQGVHVVCLGGEPIADRPTLSGPLTYRAIRERMADVCFFSAKCLDETGRISDPTEEQNYLKQLMMESSKKSVFLCDSTKFGTRSVYTLCSLEQVSYCAFDRPYESLCCTYTML